MGRECGKLDAVAEALFAAQDQELVSQRLAGPQRERWRRELVWNSNAQRKPPFEARPALAPIALEQVQVRHVIEHFVVITREGERRRGVGARLLQATDFG